MGLDTVAYEGAIQRLKAGIKKGFIDPQYGTLPVQARLLAEECQKLTPPLGKKGSGDSAAFDAGSAAVARDITRIYCPLDQSTFTNKGLKRIIKNDDRVAWNKAAMGFGDSHSLKNTTAIGFSSSTHNQFRISRGRASGLANGKRGAKKNLGMVTLGGQALMAREYISQIQKRVGWARAGWNAGIIQNGGNAPRSWISRHGMGGGGTTRGEGENPWVSVSNNTGWASYDGARIVKNAITSRIKHMEVYADTMMRVAAEKAMAKMGIGPSS